MSGTVSTEAGISPVRRWQVILTCTAIAILEGFDIQSIGVAAPKLIPQLGLGPAEAGQAFGIGQAGLVVGSLLGGFLADKFGRKLVTMLSVLAFGICTMAMLLVNSFESLVFVRFAIGLGLGSAMPNIIGMALDVAQSKSRAYTITLVLAGTPIGGMLVALFARLYMQEMGWHSLFVAGGLLPIIITPLILLLPNIARQHAQAATLPAKISRFKVLFGEGRAGQTFFLWLGNFFTMVVMYQFLNWLPSLLKGMGLTQDVGQDAVIVFHVGSIIGSLVIGRLIDRQGPRWPLTGFFAGLMVGLAGLALLKPVICILVSVAVTGFFLVGVLYAINGLGPTYYPAEGRGLGTGAALSVGKAGSIVGPMVAGIVLNMGYSSVAVVGFMAPFAVLAALSMFILTSGRRVKPSLADGK